MKNAVGNYNNFPDIQHKSFSLLAEPLHAKINLQKLELSHDPAILLVDIHPREMKTYVHIKTCTQMFMVALFIIAKK